MSLVADYGSDSNSSDVSDEEEQVIEYREVEIKFLKPCSPRHHINYLKYLKKIPLDKKWVSSVTCFSKTELKSEPESSDEDKKPKIPAPVFKLPPPSFVSDKIDDSSQESQGSVFVNPFLEAENAKTAMLQKHVKMVDTKAVAKINGKKICWNYRKGRCRFGHNCKYAHDSDLQKTQAELEADLDLAKVKGVVCQSGSSGNMLQPTQKDLEAIEEDKINGKKRKRPGLTQGLVPGKKVMKQYLHNKT